jgi:transcriptional regulator with PAS, ATPase and Fis domain
VVGRGAGCDLLLPDRAVSRCHARIAPHPAGVEVADLGSRNGTYLNGRRVQRTLAAPGALLRVGDTFLRVTCLTDPWEAAQPQGPLVGGPALAAARRLISLVGPTAMSVLLLGETGTGKEVVARLLHLASNREGRFVAVNCAALPEGLVESELFGHVTGAFTGAARARRGLFCAATGGTLFLDEIGELPMAAQAKLLRALEDGQIRPLGAEAPTRVDVRVLSATNCDPKAAIAEGRFRPDLLARLATVELHLPPLRDHPEDLQPLAAHLLGRALGREVALESHALEAMALYDWPQNVRELDSVLRSAALRDPQCIRLDLLPRRVRETLAEARRQETPDPGSPATLERPAASGRDRLEEALRRSNGNVRRASQAMGIARGHAYRMLRRWDIDPGWFRSPVPRTRCDPEAGPELAGAGPREESCHD